MPTTETIASELLTLRDFWRYAVSRFQAAGLAFGHGTATAADDAAFLLLDSLDLPIDVIDPFLDARLLTHERRLLARRIEERVTTRKPSAYLTGRAYINGLRFRIDERVIVPRSFIGEILFSDHIGQPESLLVPDPYAIETVADICTGSGCLAILAAMVFANAEVDAVDLSSDALAVARLNVADYGLMPRLKLQQGDLFGPLKDRRYDLIIANPPYVDAEEMAGLPGEYLAEPALALDGGIDGLDLVRRILEAAPRHLNPQGGLLVEIGTGRDLLQDEFPELDFLWLDTEESEGEVFWLTAAQLGVEE